MMKRLISLLLCIAMLAGMLTVTAFADPPVKNLSVAVTFDGDNLDTMQIKFDWPDHLDPAQGRAVLMNEMLQSTVTGIGVGDGITAKDIENFATYGDFTHIGYYSKAKHFATFNEVKNYFDPTPDDKGMNIISAPENNAEIKPGETTTVNLDIPDGTMENGKNYYVYLWTYYKGNLGSWRYYPDTLLCAIFIDDGGDVKFARANARNGYETVKFDVTNNTEYTITYNLGDNATTPAANPTANPDKYTAQNAVTLQAPTREGYTFTGWTGPWGGVIPVGSVGDLTYTANWTANEYSINYELNGGGWENGVSVPSTYTIEDTITLPEAAKASYIFSGWYDNAALTGSPVTEIAQNSTGDKTFYAKWTPTQYPINYVLNGGALAQSVPNPGTYTIDSVFVLPEPSKDHYEFAGWYDNADLNGNSIAQIAANNPGEKTFYAKWTPKNYGITYDLAGGTVATANPTTYTVESNDITLVNPTRGGYKFDGWTGSNGSTEQTSVTIAKGSTGDKTYTANWTPIVYTISYELGAEGTTTNPVEYTIETPTITLTDPTRWGFIFNGWTGNGVTTPTKNVTIDQGSFGDKAFKANYSPSELPEQLYPGESYILRSGLDRSQYKVSGFDFTSGRRGFNGASYIESIKIDKNGDLVMTMKENFNLALDTDKVIKGEITVVDKTTKPQTKHYVPVEGKINNDVKDIFGAKKAAEAEDINTYWGENAVLVMDEDGGYVSFSEEMLSGVVKMKKNEKAYLNLIYGVNDITEDTIDAIEEYLGEDYVDDAIIEYYTFETKAFKNEVDFSYEAYEEDPHYFYLWKNGKLKKIDVTYNDEEDVEAWQWTADAEGTIIVTDVEIVLAEENTKNPNTGR